MTQIGFVWIMTVVQLLIGKAQTPPCNDVLVILIKKFSNIEFVLTSSMRRQVHSKKTRVISPDVHSCKHIKVIYSDSPSHSYLFFIVSDI